MKTSADIKSITVISDISYSRVITDSQYVFGGHRHTSWEFKFVFDGSLEVTSDDTVVKLLPYDAMIIEPDVFHREITEGADYMVMQMELDGISPTGKSRVKQLDVTELELVKLIKHYCELYTSDGTENLNRHGSKIDCDTARQTLSKLAEVLIYTLLSDTNREKSADDGKSAIIYNKAVTYMKENLDKNLNLCEIAKHLGCCPTVLKSTFSRYTGHGIMQHFTYMRILRAKELLDKGLPASDVASMLGFSSQSYFSQCFKRECGYTPSKHKEKKLTIIFS